MTASYTLPSPPSQAVLFLAFELGWTEWTLGFSTGLAGAPRLRRRIRTTEADPAIEQVRQLLELKGRGPNSAWLFVQEFFAWRQIAHRRQLGALAGLTPTPYQSGDSEREQGISKAGKRRLRAMAIEIAWCWVWYQPQSALSQWYRHRFGHGKSRLRRLGIVALARKLFVQFWQYLKTGALPEGAETVAWRIKMTGRRRVPLEVELAPWESAAGRGGTAERPRPSHRCSTGCALGGTESEMG